MSAVGGAAVVYECPECDHRGVIADPNAAMAWFQGVPVVAVCKCGLVLKVPNHMAEKRKEQRILTPADAKAEKLIKFMKRGK